MSDFEFIYTLHCEACDENFPNQGVPVFYCPHCGSGTDAIDDPEIKPIDVRGIEKMRAEHGAMNLANVEYEKSIDKLTALLAHSPEWHVINTANDGQDLPPYGDVVEAYTVEGDLILAFRDENDDGEHWFDEVVNRTIVGLSDSWDVDSNYITHWRKHTPPTKDGDI